MQQRRGADAPQPGQTARPDAETVQGLTKEKLVRKLDRPGQADTDHQDGDLNFGGTDQPAHISRV